MTPASHALRGRVVTPTAVLPDGVVVVHDADIAWVGPAREAVRDGFGAEAAGAEAVEGYLLPGLVDLHCHGGGGVGFPDATTPAEAQLAVDEHRRHGTTSLVASLVTATPETLRARTRTLAPLCRAGELAGIHYEGPFLSSDRCGAQDPALVQLPDPGLTVELLTLGEGTVVTMTIAPEHATPDVLRVLVEGGAVPSFGHTDADPGTTRQAVRLATDLLATTPARRSRRPTVTHLFNGMRPLHHRDPGPVGELLAAARHGAVAVELIGDGTHLAGCLVRAVAEIVGAENVVLVTDAMAAAGMPDGAYRLGSRDVTVRGGVARLADGGAIAGGTAHLLDVVRTTHAAGVPLVDAVAMASTVPAEVLGDRTIGALAAGRRADMVTVDADLRPRRVIRHGRDT
ncbi:amidohydrolase family protein [Georgenia sp. 10Sc9-8]|uniref:Amidohydrolase family protein n=1 Tax=Georgenia halotolerans TaxID=3028317 RepID=A0ABT5U1Q9_9MICO|nr:amidohydrolase family protein [Georgenia halotolerans]